MSDPQREAILDAAKYLRSVRPLDPEELVDYVESHPHPAVARQVLREEATDLGIVERSDGTFVPVESGPLSLAFDGVAALPDRHERRLLDRLADRYGTDWAEGEAGRALRERIRRIKAAYLAGEAVDYDADTALAYACYHVPTYYAVAQYLLADIARDGRVPRDLRVLDVGAGVGGPALGITDLLPADALCDYHAVEPSDAAAVFEAMLADTGRNVHTTVHRTSAEAFDPRGEYDLVLFANVLSELDQPASVARRYLDHLAEEGTMVLVAPADRNTAIGLREVERALADDGPATVYAPTVRLWPDEHPASTCWSFDVKPDLAVPAFQKRLQDAADADASENEREDDGREGAANEFVNVDVQYAPAYLTGDGSTRIEYRPRQDRYAPLAASGAHVTDRVDCVAVKLSHDLGEGDGNPLFLVGDGSEVVDHVAVRAGSSTLNADLLAADYGDLLVFENVLVLWNDDEAAYNLVVDTETVVDVVPQ
jgi:SAM-dependent methyltransferase